MTIFWTQSKLLCTRFHQPDKHFTPQHINRRIASSCRKGSVAISPARPAWALLGVNKLFGREPQPRKGAPRGGRRGRGWKSEPCLKARNFPWVQLQRRQPRWGEVQLGPQWTELMCDRPGLTAPFLSIQFYDSPSLQVLVYILEL